MRTRNTLILGSLLASAVALAPPAQAAGVPAADPWVAPSATLVVTGQGFGHGNGMSQYGAKGAAAQGKNYGAILAFYYPGTKLSSLTGKIRVLMSADADNNTTVRATRGLRLTDIGRGKTWVLPTSKRPKAWRLRVVDGRTQVLYKTDVWHRYRPGGHTTLAGDGQFSSWTGLVTLRLASGDRVYRGAMRLTNRDTVNVVGIEKYLKGVIPAEMPASWPTEALRAQAVAARSYAVRERADNASRYFHVWDTTRSQVYKGYGAEVATTNAAVDATASKILTYGGAPAFTQFSSSSGGWTSSGSQPYLVAQEDIYDTADIDPYYPWTPVKTVDTAALAKAYPAIGTLVRLRIATREGLGTWGGRVETIILDGTSKDIEISGDTFRSLYGLRSTFFKFGP